MAVPGTSENEQTATSAAGGTGQSGASQPAVSSGTASAALIAAAQAASSADTGTAGNQPGTQPPAAGTGTPGATPDATGQPPAAGTTGQQPAGSGGQAPENRIVTAVKNARAEARAEVEREFNQRYGGVDPAIAKDAVEFFSELRRDPTAFYEELGRRLGKSPTAAANTDEAYPEADLVSQDGKLKTYSHDAFQKALAVHGNKVKAALMKELEPFLQFTKAAQTREEQEAAGEEHRRTILSALTEARKLKHFTKENEPGILETLQTIPEETRKALGPVAALHMAYSMFVDAKVLPTADQEAERRVRESFNKKANTSTGSVQPTGQGGDPKKTELRQGDVSGLAAHMARMAEQGAGA